MQESRPVGVRWTIGDVSERGFEALRLSIMGAWRLFGPEAAYAVCVNTVTPAAARERVGKTPAGVEWVESTARAMPEFIRRRMDERRAEGVGWKFSPLRVFPDRYEIALDNDCILWELPGALAAGIAGDGPDRCVMAEDVRPAFGRFAPLCGQEPRNSGLRGLPPGFDLASALLAAVEELEALTGEPVRMTSELDEQGLQAAALSRRAPLGVVTLEEVTVCSPFHPHTPSLGRCGAHFVGLNARHIPWDYYDRPADEWMREHWESRSRDVRERLGPAPAAAGLARPAAAGRGEESR